MNKKSEIKPQKQSIFATLPCLIIAVFIAIYPLLAAPVDISLTEAELFVVPNSGGSVGDYFLRFREIMVFSVGVTLLLYWLGERIFPDKPIASPLLTEKSARLPLICCGGYLLFAVISAVFSETPEVSFWGIATESEGVASVFGYVVLFLASYNWLRVDNIRFLKYAAIGAAAAIAVLFIIEKAYGSAVGGLIFGYEDDRYGMSLLFGNSIACGEFCVLLFPAVFLFAAEENNRLVRAAAFVLSGFTLCGMIFSRSSSAAGGLAAAVILIAAAIILRRKSIDRKKLLFAPLALVPLLIMLVVDTGGMLKSLSTQAENSGTYSPAESCHLNDIDITETAVTLDCRNCRVTITLTDESNAVITGTENETLAKLNNSSVKLDGSYAPISVSLNNRLLTLDLGYKDTIEFETTGGRPVYIGLNGYLVPQPSESAFPQLSAYYRLGTGRGYIWLNSLPLLKDCIFKGCGAGQFGFRYPQDDIVGMLNTHGTTALFTDKPHNMYLQTAILHGIPALALFLCLFAAVIVRGVKRRTASVGEYGLLISVICTLLMGVFNDSCAAYITPMWVFAGAVCVTAVQTSAENAKKSKKRV